MEKRMPVAGVIGSHGDLGRQVGRLLISHGYLVLENDKRFKGSISLSEMAERCDVIHYCVPAKSITKGLDTKALIILHDSVMEASEAASRKHFKGLGVPVHMLMNKEAVAVVARGFAHTKAVMKHLMTLGQVSSLLAVKEHDRLIARSQAPLLLLIEILLKDLRSWKKRGLLTPSAVDLLESLESRQANWTLSTRRSILANKQIDAFIDDLRRVKRGK